MAAPSYLDLKLAENETPVDVTGAASNLEAVHIFNSDSIHAINAALASGRPLLVRGEPGVGKSQLARAAAKQLARFFLQRSIDIQTEAQDLLWHFDSVRRLAEAQVAGAFTHWLADASEEQFREAWEAKLALSRFLYPGPLWWAFDWEDAKQQASRASCAIPRLEDGADPKKGCVLLIDEIDKAESDVPNGLLEALGAGQFTPIGQAHPVVAKPPFPLVVITTNEERVLPDAFLRRCVVLNLELPLGEQEFIRVLANRGKRHFPKFNQDLLEEAGRQLFRDRKVARENGLRPLPGQAEYMDLLRALKNLGREDEKKQRELLSQIGQFILKKHKDGR